ncbi:MAG: endonuclease MutS2 [Candidatus Tyrphobacter sp.]
MPFADERTLEALEFSAVRERVVAATRTERGRRYAESLLPDDAFERVRAEQGRTAAARELVAAADLHALPAVETQPLTVAAEQGRVLAPRELRLVGEAVAAAAAAYRAVRDDATLREIGGAYASLEPLRRTLANAIDERDVILDRASPALGRIRRSVKQAQEESRERVGAILRAPKYANAIQDAVVTIRDGRFVVPIKAAFAHGFPGIVHDTSASGQTLFVEPLAALETNNRLRTLRLEEEHEIERILGELSRGVGENAAQIEVNVEMLAGIDLLVAKARLAIALDAVAPVLDEEPSLEIARGRHPLLGERAVPQSLSLNDATRLLVISGPNMGGKTVTLKMVGLFLAMAYAGMQVPAAEGSRIGRFTHLIADVGDEQSIVENASTFSAHLDRMREILATASKTTIFLVDEIGAGTEPSAGAALAAAMLEHLLVARARGVVSTHATELKLFAHAAEGAANASVRFDPRTFSATFELDVGSPGQSFAFALARSRGIAEEVVRRGESLLALEEREYERALAELSARNAELQHERATLADERRASAAERERLERRIVELRVEQERFAARAEERLQQALREFMTDLQRRSPENAKRSRLTPSQSAALSRTLEQMHRDLGMREVQDDAVPRERVAFPLSGMEQYRPAGASARFDAAASARSELDVRGKRYADAEPLVDRWIDEALLAGSSPLRLIHGKGTGMLGRGLQEFLRAHPAVASVRYGNEEEGSHGVTIIDLNDR